MPSLVYYFKNLTVKSSPIVLKFVLELSHSKMLHFGQFDLKLELRVVPEKFVIKGNFLVTKFLNSFLLNFNLLTFWVIVGDHLRIRKSLIDMLFDCFFVRVIVPLIWY